MSVLNDILLNLKIAECKQRVKTVKYKLDFIS